jgi:hypothetical protein
VRKYRIAHNDAFYFNWLHVDRTANSFQITHANIKAFRLNVPASWADQPARILGIVARNVKRGTEAINSMAISKSQ